jgi:hypothetical protein
MPNCTFNPPRAQCPRGVAEEKIDGTALEAVAFRSLQRHEYRTGIAELAATHGEINIELPSDPKHPFLKIP